MFGNSAGGGDEVRGVLDAGVIDQKVQATELGLNSGKEALGICLDADVADEGLYGGRGTDRGPNITGAFWLHGPGTYESRVPRVIPARCRR
jgi:hypothetical protein